MLRKIFGRKIRHSVGANRPFSFLAGQLLGAGREAWSYVPSCGWMDDLSEAAWSKLSQARPDAVRDRYGEVTYPLDLGSIFGVTLSLRWMEDSKPSPVKISGLDLFDGIVLIFPYMETPITRLDNDATPAAAELHATCVGLLRMRDGNRELANWAARFAQWKASQPETP